MVARLALLLAALLPAPASAFDHDVWDGLLKRHVESFDGGRASRVRYAAMARERAALQGYLQRLASVQEQEFAGWSEPEQMAFLINAYNAAAVEKVLTRYPDLRSIRDFGRVFGDPFKERFFSLLGARRSLDDVEHEMLRKKFREPRLHFALNCASVGCPMLREEAYAAVRLERQLVEQAARFLSDGSRNRYRDGRLEVSKIFDWYRADFEPRDEFFRRYARELGMPPGAAPRVVFLDYDWSLNASR